MMAQLAERKRNGEKAAIESRYHEWTSADGKYTYEAEVTKYTNGVVTLVDRAGKEKRVPIDQLSESDRAYVDDWRKEKQRNAKVIQPPVRDT